MAASTSGELRLDRRSAHAPAESASVGPGRPRSAHRHIDPIGRRPAHHAATVIAFALALSSCVSTSDGGSPGPPPQRAERSIRWFR